MNGQSSRRALKTSFRASPTSIRPLYTGGPVLLTRDGAWLITTMGEGVEVTEVSSGRAVARVKGDTTPITALALSYHTSPPTLITAHQSNTVRYYPLPGAIADAPAVLPYVRALPKVSSAPILVAALSPDSTLLALGSSDGVVKVLDVAGGYATHIFRGHGGPVSALHFSFPHARADADAADGQQRMELWTGSTDAKVRVYDLRDAGARVVGGDAKARARHTLDGHVSVVRGISVSDDGRIAITGGRDRVVLVWDMGDGQAGAGAAKGKGKEKEKGAGGGARVVQTLMPNEQVESCGLLPPGTRIGGREGLLCWTAGDKGQVRVWDVRRGDEVATMRGVEGVDEADDDDDEQRGIIAVLHDATSGSLVSVHADQNILFHSLTTLAVTRQIVGFNDEIIDALFLPSHVALATNSSLIRIYATGTLDARLLAGHGDMVLCLDKSADGRLLVSGSKDHTARLWARGEDGAYRCVAVCEGHAESVGAVAFARKDARFLVTASQDRTIKLWDLAPLAAALGADSAADELAAEPAKVRSIATVRAHEKDINALDVAPNDRFLVSASQDKTLKVYEIDFSADAHAGSSGAVRHVGTCKGHRRGVWTVRFSRNDRIIASGAADRSIKLWSLDDFTCLKTFEGHTNSVLRVDFLSAGMQLVSSASDGLVKLWNIKDEECVKTLDNHEDRIWALAVSPDEKTILSAGADSLATFWEDSTEVEQAEKNEALVKAVQSEQEFTNYLSLKDYRRAILLALAMSQPGRLLQLFTAVRVAPAPGSHTGAHEVDAVVRGLSALDLVRLLKFVRDWNANARTSGVAQAVLHAILRLRTPDDIMAAFEAQVDPAPAPEPAEEPAEEDGGRRKGKKDAAPIGIRELLEGLIPYSERHFGRIDRLVQESYLLDYTIGEMDGGVFGTEVMDVDV
ncbi:U3 small nucleolar RNA-associated protein 13 [Cryptotrichosporon argae]